MGKGLLFLKRLVRAFIVIRSHRNPISRLGKLFVAESLEPRLQLTGVTIITHGFNDNTVGWVTSMAHAMAAAAAEGSKINPSVYKLSVDSSLNVTGSWLEGGPPQGSATYSPPANPEIFVLLDWSSVAGQVVSSSFPFLGGVHRGTVDVAAAVVPKLLDISLNGISHPLAELPIHIIGHSRGGSLAIELAKDLGQQGVWVDQVTTLDPHPVDGSLFPDSQLLYPLNIWGDAPVSLGDLPLSDNIVFADNYYEETALPNNVAVGTFVNGAHNLGPLSLPGGHALPGADHNDVHSFYQGTINQSSTDGDINPIPSIWYTGDQRSIAGFAYTLLAGATRPSDGMWSSATRSHVNLTVSGADAWDNVSIGNQDTSIVAGTAIIVSPAYGDGNGAIVKCRG